MCRYLGKTVVVNEQQKRTYGEKWRVFTGNRTGTTAKREEKKKV